MLRHASVLASVVAIAALLEGSALSQARSRIVRGYGMTLVVPGGWKARIYKRLGGPPIAKAANFNFPRGDDDAGTDAQKEMRSGDVLLILFRLSSGGSAPESARYLTVSQVTVRRRDFKALWKGVPTARHAFAQRTFRFQGDLFDLWAQFGTRPAGHRAVLDANTVLRSLSVSRD